MVRHGEIRGQESRGQWSVAFWRFDCGQWYFIRVDFAHLAVAQDDQLWSMPARGLAGTGGSADQRGSSLASFAIDR